MKSWAWAAICISIASLGAMTSAAGCSSDDPATDDDDDGEGGAGSGGAGAGTGNVGPSTGTGTSTGTGPGPGPSSSGTGASTGQSCDDLPCSDMDMDNTNDCIACSVVGDPGDFEGGSECQEEYIACFGGMDDMCTGGEVDCCALLDCAEACPEDDPATPADENLDCFCTNDGTACTDMQMAGSCAGDHQAGWAVYVPVVACVFGEVCPNACAE